MAEDSVTRAGLASRLGLLKGELRAEMFELRVELYARIEKADNPTP